MMHANLNELSAVQMFHGIHNGDFTAGDVASACLDRIANRDGGIKAFVATNRELTLQEAGACPTKTHGFLQGVPFAVKDVIDSADYPTQYGSLIYKGYQARRDASCIAQARQQGGILLGKTTTCEFATTTPSTTRNPLSFDHTPGGSSSGSAAAVADYMVPVAFATQTAGSTIRPAVYCGAVGYKPTFGAINTTGIKPISPSLDTIGLITRSVEDAAFFFYGLHGRRIALDRELAGLRIGVCHSSQWQHARPETVSAIDKFVGKLQKNGANVSFMDLPAEFEAVASIQSRLSFYEIRQSLAYERMQHFGLLGKPLQERFSEPFDVSLEDYLGFSRHTASLRERSDALFGDVDVLLYPTADGEAEPGLASTGSPRFCTLWTLLHVPAVSFPISTGPAGLPIGIQLIARRGRDADLMNAAAAASRLSDFRLPRTP